MDPKKNEQQKYMDPTISVVNNGQKQFSIFPSRLRRLELGFGTDVNSTGREDIRQICSSFCFAECLLMRSEVERDGGKVFLDCSVEVI